LKNKLKVEIRGSETEPKGGKKDEHGEERKLIVAGRIYAGGGDGGDLRICGTTFGDRQWKNSSLPCQHN
jgi:hypothetical protein